MIWIFTWFILGVLADRYFLPVLDLYFELLKMYVARIYSAIKIEIELMNKEYEDIIDNDDKSKNAIGFNMTSQDNEDQTSCIAFTYPENELAVIENADEMYDLSDKMRINIKNKNMIGD